MWITFPDFLSSGWIAQQELVVLNTIERVYGKAFDQNWRQVYIFRKGSALIVEGLDAEFTPDVQRALVSHGMEVSLRTGDSTDRLVR